MDIFNFIKQSDCKTAVALGCFDGLHLGHIKVIKEACKDADKGLLPSVFTFSDNPINILNSNVHIKRLISDKTKFELLSKIGIKRVYNIDFRDVMNMNGEDFVTDILIKRLNVGKIYCGFNYHFGAGGQLGVNQLKSICKKYSIDAVSINAVKYDGLPISSTRIRQCILDGNISLANSLLGRRFGFDFEVIKGNQLGRTIGVPTMNQRIPQDFILPKFGVYASYSIIKQRPMKSITNIGIRPTVGADYPLAETWIPGYNCGNMYGKDVKIELAGYIRGEKKFESISDLKDRILEDKEEAFKILDSDKYKK